MLKTGYDVGYDSVRLGNLITSLIARSIPSTRRVMESRVRDLKPEDGEKVIGFADFGIDNTGHYWINLDAVALFNDYAIINPNSAFVQRKKYGEYSIRLNPRNNTFFSRRVDTPLGPTWEKANLIHSKWI